MTKNYFSIERAGRCVTPVIIKNENDIMFEDLMNMSYEDMKSYEELEFFVDCVMSVANKCFTENDELTIITLIGEDGTFIWSVILEISDDPNKIMYALVDWTKDGKSYRYEKD